MNGAKLDEPDTLAKASEFIPDLYYDIIARMIPGGLFLVAIAKPLIDSKVLDVSKVESALAAILFIALSYVAGMLLTSCSLLIDAVWALVVYFLRKICKPTNSIQYPWDLAEDIDRIRYKNPFAAHMLFKMYAEVTLFENLFFAILAFLSWDAVQRYVLIVMVPLALGLVFRIVSVSRRTRSWLGLISER